MNKMVLNLLAVTMSVLPILTPIRVFAETTEPEYNTLGTIVIAVNEQGDCWLSNDYMLSQAAFRHYSGEEFDLQSGDVIGVTSKSGIMSGLTTHPSQYILGNDSIIIYRGRAEELYADYVKELTVTEDGALPMWSDDEGNIYNTRTMYVWERGGVWDWEKCSGVSPYDFNVGDTALCVTEYKDYYGIESRFAIILEMTYEAPHTAGDANGDGNIDIVDVIAINKHILLGKSLSQEGIEAVDFNSDGKVDATESLTLLKYVVKIVDELVFMEDA